MKKSKWPQGFCLEMGKTVGGWIGVHREGQESDFGYDTFELPIIHSSGTVEQAVRKWAWSAEKRYSLEI